jgi:hypothetical protein
MNDTTNQRNRNDRNALPGYFTELPHEITLAQNISALDRDVWTVIAAHCVAPNETCFPGEDRIAALQGKDVRTIQRSVNRLRAAGLLVIEGRHPKFKTNVYRPCLPDGTSYAKWRAAVTHVTHGVTHEEAANHMVNATTTPPSTHDKTVGYEHDKTVGYEHDKTVGYEHDKVVALNIGRGNR